MKYRLRGWNDAVSLYLINAACFLFFVLLLALPAQAVRRQFPPHRVQPDCQVQSYHTGHSDIQSPTRYGLLMMGGGTDVDQAFRWMIERSGGGDLVVLRSAGEDGYNDYLYRELGGLNSVTTFVIDSYAKALCPDVAKAIRQAEAIFFAGGDQSEYYSYWKDTPVHQAIEYLARTKKVPLGGTSAGLAILGQVIYSAEEGSIQSPDALADPFHPDLTLRADFLNLPLMRGVLTDTHFAERDRQGRFVTFLARTIHHQLTTVTALKGIAIDERTAALVDEQGLAQIVGAGSVWFFKPQYPPMTCVPHQPLHWNLPQAVHVQKLSGVSGQNVFDITHWKPISGQPESFYYSVDDGQLNIR